MVSVTFWYSMTEESECALPQTVLQEIMDRAVKLKAHAINDFGREFADYVKVFIVLQDRLLRAVSP